MQIAINIDDEDYNNITLTGKNTINLGVLLDLREAVRKGTPLPKGHGRLIDADEIDNNIYDLTRSMDLNYGQISEVVDTAPTIIEADRSKEHG